MPVDLSAAGLPSLLPSPKRHVLAWLAGWLVCAIVGAALALLLWPANTPAKGVWFWFCAVGVPNLVFLVILGITRTSYEAALTQAIYRNQHRQMWLAKRITYAQQPLLVLGTGYCLPFTEPSLCEALTGSSSHMRMQAPRNGAGVMMHGRFGDNDPRVTQWADDGAGTDEAAAADSVFDEPPAAHAEVSAQLDHPVSAIIAAALAPLMKRTHVQIRSTSMQHCSDADCPLLSASPFHPRKA